MTTQVSKIDVEGKIMPEKRFIGIKECSEYLGVKVSTLYSWVSMKKIPYVKMGGLVRFDLRELEVWIKKRKVNPHPIWDK